MKATELRIGNWVTGINGIDFQVSHVTIGHLDPDKLNDLLLKPIPLTEEWLKLVNGFSFVEDLSFAIWADKNGVSLEQYGEGRMRLFHVKYVHQLQNLYFALTGEELELKK